MTEEEAKTKWCPQTRLTASGSEWHTNRGPGQGDPAKPASYLCLGSACMAWRWRLEEVDSAARYNMASYPPRPPIYRQTEQGYCGLAGSSL